MLLVLAQADTLPRATITKHCQGQVSRLLRSVLSDSSRSLSLSSHGVLPVCLGSLSLLYVSRDHPNPLKLDYIFKDLFPKTVAFTRTRD